MSDSGGTIVDDDGIDEEKLGWIMALKNARRGRIREYVEKYPRAQFHEGKRPWAVKCDMAFPCAIENEIGEADAKQLVDGGCVCVCASLAAVRRSGAVQCGCAAKRASISTALHCIFASGGV